VLEPVNSGARRLRRWLRPHSFDGTLVATRCGECRKHRKTDQRCVECPGRRIPARLRQASWRAQPPSGPLQSPRRRTLAAPPGLHAAREGAMAGPVLVPVGAIRRGLWARSHPATTTSVEGAVRHRPWLGLFPDMDSTAAGRGGGGGYEPPSSGRASRGPWSPICLGTWTLPRPRARPRCPIWRHGPCTGDSEWPCSSPGYGHRKARLRPPSTLNPGLQAAAWNASRRMELSTVRTCCLVGKHRLIRRRYP
jgi:hypothetical protein